MNINGLNNKEVIKYREEYGTNSLSRIKQDSFFKKLLITFSDPIIKILLIALLLKVIVMFKHFDWYETIGIVIAILFASLISTISEYGSEKAFQKLQEESSKLKCKVIRNGKKIEIEQDDIVVNDIVSLEAGDRIPADGILVRGTISVDESSINGEMKEFYKEAALNVEKPTDKNIVFRGTVVYSNNALMKVTKVGDNTFYGKLSLELQEKNPDTPLKIRLRELANFISKIGYIGAFLVFISYLFSCIVIKNHFNMNHILNTIHNFPLLLSYLLYAFTLCVTIIIVAVPEGLPMMITLVLSSNMKRMLKNNVLVRKLVGIETAGNINILFTDKTGTLTKGKLKTIKFIVGNMKEFENEDELLYLADYDMIKMSAVINNDSTYSNNEIIGGNITDKAVLGFFKPYKYRYELIKQKSFNSQDKYSYSYIKINNSRICLVKGAFEILADKCKEYYYKGKTYPFNRNNMQKAIDKYARQGMRIISFAFSNSSNMDSLTFLGIMVIKDEIREEAKKGVELVKNAHINIVMMTGDNKNTAISVAKETGILDDDGLVLTSSELNQLSDEKIEEILPKLRVVARSLPTDKSRLVKISREANYVVGMTGDGVNDAPALKRADVGFGMGSGTEVAKEASDIVILDDNFLSISKAILYGRTIFKSIRKFIIVQLTINMCALGISIVGPFIGIEMPITVIQMLWINMVMDTLAGLAFSFEPPLIEYMSEKPLKKKSKIINKYMINQITVTGFYSSLLCIFFLKSKIVKNMFRYDVDNKYLYTAFFGLFIFIDIFNSFNARTYRINILSNIFRNKIFICIISFIVIVQIILIYYGGNIFRTSGLTFKEFEIMILFAFSVIPLDWIRKLYVRKKGIKKGV